MTTGHEDQDEAEQANRDALSDRERKAIASLRRVADKRPRSLTVASMGGSLVVVRTGDARFEDGWASQERAAAIIDRIDGIPNTGGDW